MHIFKFKVVKDLSRAVNRAQKDNSNNQSECTCSLCEQGHIPVAYKQILVPLEPKGESK